jgi:hypothetical protein
MMEPYSRIGLLRSYGNLQSYWTTTKLWKHTVVLDYYEAMETYSRIGLLRSYGNLQSYWTTTKLWKLTVVLEYYEAMETYRSIGKPRSTRYLYIKTLTSSSDVTILISEDIKKTTLETSEEDVTLHSKRVKKT